MRSLRQLRPTLFKYATIFAAAWALSAALRTFVGEWFVVPTSVMLPTIWPGDWLWVSKNFSEQDIHKGELVAHRTKMQPDRIALRRIVGLPGDSLKMISGRLWNMQGPLPFEEDPKQEGCGNEFLGELHYPICLGSLPADSPALITLQGDEFAVAADHRTSVDFSPVFEIIQRKDLYGVVTWGFRPKLRESIRIHGK